MELAIGGCSEAELRSQRAELARWPGYSQDTIDWPMGDRVADTPVTGVDRARLDPAVASSGSRGWI